MLMNKSHRKPLPGTKLDYFDARAAVNALKPGAYDKLPYTSRVHAENIVRKADPAIIEESLTKAPGLRLHRAFAAPDHEAFIAKIASCAVTHQVAKGVVSLFVEDVYEEYG